jgi:hypothetical protein
VLDRTKTVNQMHGILLEFGISLPVGKAVITRLPAIISEHPLPPRLVAILDRLHAHFKYLDEQIAEIDKEMSRQLADDDLGATGNAVLKIMHSPTTDAALRNGVDDLSTAGSPHNSDSGKPRKASRIT